MACVPAVPMLFLQQVKRVCPVPSATTDGAAVALGRLTSPFALLLTVLLRPLFRAATSSSSPLVALVLLRALQLVVPSCMLWVALLLDTLKRRKQNREWLF
jgi:hypothetical protein